MVHVWTTTRKQASIIPLADLNTIQNKFGNRLEITQEHNGGIRITPLKRSDEAPLDIFMAAHTDLTSQIVRI